MTTAGSWLGHDENFEAYTDRARRETDTGGSRLAWPHLVPSERPAIQSNYSRATEGDQCKHQPFLSPYTSGQVDKVLKGNKCGLTATSKSSARGLLLLRAQECCC